jgi:nucleotide-binding universal stress UspA family protein
MKRFKNILYVVERAVDQHAAIAKAVSLAQDNQARLTVLDVLPPVTGGYNLPPGGPVTADLKAALYAQHRDAAEQLLAPHRAATKLDIRLELREGTVFLQAIQEVLREGYDLVIKAAEDPSWIDRLFGSDDMHLLRKCPCPVWLIKAEDKPNYGCILAAVDFDPERPETIEGGVTREVLELAAALALSDFATLHLVHVWDAPEADFLGLWADKPGAAVASLLEGEGERHRSAMGRLSRTLKTHVGEEAFAYLAPHFHVRQGTAKTLIPELAREFQADLVVMGTVGRTGIAGLFIGNTAEAILDQLRCAVLTTKPPGFVSPVKADQQPV